MASSPHLPSHQHYPLLLVLCFATLAALPLLPVDAGCPGLVPPNDAAESVASARLRERAAQGPTSNIKLDRRRASHDDHPREIEYPNFDGFYNNLGNPSLGGHDTQMMRYLPPAYADGTQSLSNPNGPEPRVVSERTMAGTIGTESQLGRTVMLTHFGQHIGTHF
jgi:hypothetical protein